MNSTEHILKKAARTIRLTRVITGFLQWFPVASGALLVLLWIDNLFRLPAALRFPCAVVLFALGGGELYRRVIRPAVSPIPAEQAALHLEKHLGIQDNLLINAYQFQQRPGREETQPWIDATVAMSGSHLAEEKIKSLWPAQKIRKMSWIAAALLISTSAYGILFPQQAFNAWVRLMLPLADRPPIGSYQISLQPDTGITLVEGEDLEITAIITHTGTKPDVTPVLVWKEDIDPLPPSLGAGENAPLRPKKEKGTYGFHFSDIKRAFSFRVWAGDTYSRSIRVDIQRLPRIVQSAYRVTPPAYTGLKEFSTQGPPSPLSVLPNSSIRVELTLDESPTQVQWITKGKTSDFKKGSEKNSWKAEIAVLSSQDYAVKITDPLFKTSPVIAKGQISLLQDRPPEIDFQSEDRNRFVNPGTTVTLGIEASDDYGIASVWTSIAKPEDPQSAKTLKAWTYMGPPGNKGPINEKAEIYMDPAVFLPGAVYSLTAVARDFSPKQQATASRPIVLRIKAIQEITVPSKDPIEELFNLIKGLIAEQTRANGLTQNLALHLDEALAAKSTRQHMQGMSAAQTKVRTSGSAAIKAAQKVPEAKPYQTKLEFLVNGEMGWVINAFPGLEVPQADKIKSHLNSINERQIYILNELIALLGKIGADRADHNKDKAAAGQKATPVAAREALEELKEDLKKFVDEQKQIIKASKSFVDLAPQDLTEKVEANIGELAREEANAAAFLQEKLMDLSKVPTQDFADGKVSEEINEVFQEVQKAADSLYKKNMTIAVTQEQAAAEKAEELVQNLEKWLPNSKDSIKWAMEETPNQIDAPMAELPKELEDIVGELLDDEKTMEDDVEDVSSTAFDSIDKGAGWGASDGPISNMSAKGVTGNQLPNKNEVGGRSGEGREGKSSGQMVEDTASGKGGRETPTRMTPTPFEQGSVKDESKNTKGGATGGGKSAGSGQEGLKGPPPPPVQNKMNQLAEQQAKLRQEAEALALKLRKQRKPTGDFETAINAMKEMEEAARKGDGVRMAQGYHEAVDALKSAKSSMRNVSAVHREEEKLPENIKRDILNSTKDRVPEGYEEMTSAYFRSLSEQKAP